MDIPATSGVRLAIPLSEVVNNEVTRHHTKHEVVRSKPIESSELSELLTKARAFGQKLLAIIDDLKDENIPRPSMDSLQLLRDEAQKIHTDIVAALDSLDIICQQSRGRKGGIDERLARRNWEKLAEDLKRVDSCIRTKINALCPQPRRRPVVMSRQI